MNRFDRFKDAIWFGVDKTIVIGGCGGTGSHISILLSRMANHTLYLYDDDTYDVTNLSGQFVMLTDVNKLKVDALSKNIKLFSGLDVIKNNQKYEEDSLVEDIMFACFDNMHSRKLMFDKWRINVEDHDEPENCLFVDIRLTAESFFIFFVQGDKKYQIEHYFDNLFKDSEVIPLACSYKQTTHTATMSASMTVSLFTNWLSNNVSKQEIYHVPYQTEFYVPNFLFIKTDLNGIFEK